jgi:hypothetical protein
MQKLLKQKTTGNVFMWTPMLAARPDMEPYEPPPKPVEEENTNENPETAEPEITESLSIEDALEVFKKEAIKPVRKPKQQTGEA